MWGGGCNHPRLQPVFGPGSSGSWGVVNDKSAICQREAGEGCSKKAHATTLGRGSGCNGGWLQPRTGATSGSSGEERAK